MNPLPPKNKYTLQERQDLVEGFTEEMEKYININTNRAKNKLEWCQREINHWKLNDFEAKALEISNNA